MRHALVAFALLAVPFAGNLEAQTYFEARNSAMGGTGVASSRYKAAPFANPALLTRHGPDDDFGFILPVVGVSADDTTDLSADLEDFSDEYDRIDQLLATDPTQITQGDLDSLAARLEALDARDLKANVGAGFTIAMPSDKLAWSLHLKSYADVTAFADIDPADVAAIEGSLGNPVLPDLQSNARGLGVAITEVGLSFAHQYEVSGMPLSIGITPKLQRVDTINYGVDVNSFDSGDVNEDQYLTEDSGFNVDIGAALETSNGFVFGLVARDLIAADYESADSPLGAGDAFVYEIGPSATAGAAWGNDWVTLAADLDLVGRKGIKEAGTALAANGIEDDLQFWSLGAEFDLAHWFQLRAGYRGEVNGNMDDAITGGFGLSPFDVFHVEVAGMYIDDNSLGAVAQISFTF